jgi:ArsR family metal-binding transcriptional regulator
MLVETYMKIETFYPPCRPGKAEWINLTAAVDVDISEVFLLRGDLRPQRPHDCVQTRGFQGVTLHSHEVAVTKSQDPAEAKRMLDEAKELLNATYRDRDHITPNYRQRAQLRMHDHYKLLPRDNCGGCGEPTCMAFAARLVREELPLSRCRPISREINAEAKRRLLDLFEQAGYSPGP